MLELKFGLQHPNFTFDEQGAEIVEKQILSLPLPTLDDLSVPIEALKKIRYET